MKLDNVSFTPVLFPHSILTDSEAERLLLLIPKLRVIFIFHPEIQRDQLRSFLECCFPIKDGNFLEDLRKMIINDQRFIAEHSDAESLVMIEKLFEEKKVEAAPFQIVSRVKGYSPKNKNRGSLWNAAYFLQLSIELEKRSIEIAEKFDHIHELEGEFKQVLGLEEENGGDPFHLALYRNPAEEYRNTNLERKMESWLRLWIHAENELSIPVIVSKNVKGKLKDLFGDIQGSLGNGKLATEEVVAKVSDPAVLTMADVTVLRNRLLEGKIITNGWQALSEFLITGNNDKLEVVRDSWFELDRGVKSMMRRKYSPQVEISLTVIEGYSGYNMPRMLQKYLESGELFEPEEGNKSAFLTMVPL